ncbi:HEPN domain-containing protein [Candidatus Pantoea formicae]|uniref:HEPN domain-containing protein n=1 Tax=Candidatus Pantoea formicae TaxID=2608355 RepID=UPI003EDA8BF5
MTKEKIILILSDSYVKFKNQVQDTFDFTVLVCSAVPVLKRNIVLFDKKIIQEITKADHYQPKGVISREKQERINSDLKRRSVGYKNKLCKYTLLSNFSFFESYVFDVIEELINYHGGVEKIINNSTNRTLSLMNSSFGEIESHRSKIRKINKLRDHRVGEYKNATLSLLKKDFRFPSEMFSSFGVKMLSNKINSLKSVDIPDFLKEAFSFDLSDSDAMKFHDIRQLRNKIAHGDEVNLSLADITEKCKLLSAIAKEFDQHLLRNYFISEQYL